MKRTGTIGQHTRLYSTTGEAMLCLYLSYSTMRPDYPSKVFNDERCRYILLLLALGAAF